MDSLTKLEVLVFDVSHINLPSRSGGKAAVSLVTWFINGKWNIFPYISLTATEIMVSTSDMTIKRILNHQDYTEFLLLKDSGYEACVDYFNAKYGETNGHNINL